MYRESGGIACKTAAAERSKPCDADILVVGAGVESIAERGAKWPAKNRHAGPRQVPFWPKLDDPAWRRGPKCFVDLPLRAFRSA
jgi:hypothetical protein